MNLFTSSSELKVIAAVVLVFGAVELGIRAIEDKLSIDVKHIHAIPSIIAGLDRQPAPHVVFLGNSLTRTSIRTEAIEEVWPAAPSMVRIHPDDTTLLDWYYTYQRYLGKAKPRPNLIVVSFVRSQLDDNQELHVDRLGSHFAGFQFACEAFEHDVRETGDRIEFMLAGAFRAMANRERVQYRILASVPGYKELANAVNRGVRVKEGKLASQSGVPSYTRLHRFLAAAGARGDRVLFVAIPLPRPYKVAGELRDAIQEGGANLIDMQGVEPLTRQDFPDGYHLSEEAAPRFSRALGRAMMENEFVQAALRGGAKH
ncbi:MAG: hypothetical protein OEU68_06455 [Nitrospira sp.]|nr:hypothetical protein [Nitrospira sp.]MDH4245721.1 hypothetical protein [Nitrospira sp.]MDH4355997.1 hypothetical protein [Nitrospira sp.]MDH5317797.1 hypothetical protein [Nitrospira sp.]